MATLEQIQAKMDKLKAQAEALAAKNAQVIVDKIRALMLQHGLTTKDIEADAKTKRAAKTVGGKAAGGVKTSKKSGGKVAAKYQDPKSGATWTGRGRAPAWIASAKDRSKFLIGSGASEVAAANPAAVSKVKSNVKGKASIKGNASATAAKKASAAGGATVRQDQQKAEQAARYRDPKSGATWSGRGRAPLWIAGAKDRNKFLIDGAQAVAPVAKTNKPKAAVTKAAVTKTPAPKKVSAAKKAVVTKSPAASGKVAAKKPVVSLAKPEQSQAKPETVAAKPETVKTTPVKKVAVKKAAVKKAAVKKVAVKKAAVKKAALNKTAAVDAVAASPDVPAAPVASTEPTA